MIHEKKNYKVRIFDDYYLLVSDEPEGVIQKAADMVDALMREIDNQATIADPKKIAVLAALRIADKYISVERLCEKEQHKKTALVDFIDQELSTLYSS